MTTKLNGINTTALVKFAESIMNSPEKGLVHFQTTSRWTGQTRVNAEVLSYTLGDSEIPRHFNILSDEPEALLGENTAPNPQELLFAALNACMIVGYVANASARGIKLDKLEIQTTGQLDLRGFLALDDTVKPGYDFISYTIRVKGNATPDQFADLHAHIQKTSPNYFNLARPIPLRGTLHVE